MFLNYLALGLLCFGGLVIFYGIIVIHDIPYEIAVKRNHPHQDAIHAAGWVSLLTLHVLWPFIWIWAMLYREERGWGFSKKESDELAQLHARLALLERQLASKEEKNASPSPQ
ncbi:DUF3302 domain-containing protein [Dryocola clanedunensis]|uniref:DUF3302 domain-containing protein n=1 Tax=Cedecea sulfonylureivorans TaxID=3051154 RepID=UPI001928B79B|nr:DUF3302 domain-containing protein [Cedecea sulfonylureivorans]